MPYPDPVFSAFARLSFCVFLLLSAGQSPLISAEREWLSATDGDFGSDSNWSDSEVPGEFDTAIFNLAETFTVTFGADHINELAKVADGNVTFSLAPSRTYTITDTFTVGSVSSQSPTLSISGGAGSSLSVAKWVVGSGANAESVTTTITGSDTQVDVSGSFASDPLGGGNLFVTRIENGAQMSIGGGLDFDNQSNVTVSGSGSLLELTGRLQNTRGASVLKVQDGGVFEGADARIAARTSNMTVVVTGANSEWKNTAIWFGERPNDNKRSTVLDPTRKGSESLQRGNFGKDLPCSSC